MAIFLKKNKLQKFLENSLSKWNKDNTNKGEETPELKRIRRRIVWQVGLAGLTIVLTLVIVFAMTSAWYTNIVNTSGLIFEAEAWGFDGDIVVNSDPIMASPGDTGTIHLEAVNENEGVAAVSVNISKSSSEAEMQKRLFFYVDAQQIRNNETMDRIYLSEQEGYTYTLFSQGNLTLTETTHNDAPLKWQWVYDVLGYYVLGMANGDNTDVTEIEYLRPIEYDYDEATTTFKTEKSETGNDDILTMELVTVDGTTSVNAFLYNLSRSDGYAGLIDPNSKLESGHYPVDVDENGYGVYAYLCNYSEIEMATQYDTDLGVAASQGGAKRYEVKLTVSAQKNKNSVANVSTLAALKNMIAEGSADVIQLSSNIAIGVDDSLVITEGQKIMLDLNGYTITSKCENAAITAQPGSSLTMINGSIVGTKDFSNYAIYSMGAEVLLSNVEITDVAFGLYISDNSTNAGLDSKVRMLDCAINTSDSAIVVKGNGILSEQPTLLVIENCEINSDDIAICGNGTTTGSGQWGTDIQIIGSNVTSNPEQIASGIYHPQKDSTLTIYNSRVSGYTGIAIKGGSVTVDDSTITGHGAQVYPAAQYASASGFADTADGIYIETNYGYDISLKIRNDSIITSDAGQSLQIYHPEANNVAVEIYSGNFDQPQPEEYLAEGAVQENSIVKVK